MVVFRFIVAAAVALCAAAEHRLDKIVSSGNYPDEWVSIIRAAPGQVVDAAVSQFADMDANSDKKVTQLEFFEYCSKNKMSRQQHVLAEAWTSANVDGDKVLRFYEWFVTLASEHMKQDPNDHLQGFRAAVSAMDGNGDGSLDESELVINTHNFEKVLGLDAHDLKKSDFTEFIKFVDKNEDSKLNSDEVTWAWFVLSPWSPFMKHTGPRYDPTMTDANKDTLAKKLPGKAPKAAFKALEKNRFNHFSDNHETVALLKHQNFMEIRSIQQSFEWQKRVIKKRKERIANGEPAEEPRKYRNKELDEYKRKEEELVVKLKNANFI